MQAGLARKIRRRYLTEMRSGSKGKEDKNAGQLSTEATLEQMRDDWENNRSSTMTMMLYMNDLRERRMRATLNQSAADHLRLYPALRLVPVVSHEYFLFF